MKSKIAIIMGSDSDWKIMSLAKKTIQDFNSDCHCQVVSAHRTPDDLSTFSNWCEDNDVQVIIAAAGGAAHLPGMIASYTTIPVIGVPINTTSLNGLDSLLSIVQMPKGIPVATVAIDNATNAALLALRILSLNNLEIKLQLIEYQKKSARESRDKTKNLV